MFLLRKPRSYEGREASYEKREHDKRDGGEKRQPNTVDGFATNVSVTDFKIFIDFTLSY